MDELTKFMKHVEQCRQIEVKKTTYFQDSIKYLENFFGKKLNNDKNEYTGDQYFEMFVRDCHPFMFELSNGGTPKTEDQIVPNEEPIDLPYPSICIESIRGHTTVPNDEDEHGIKMYINAIFVREMAPREYEFLAHTSFRLNDGKKTMVHMLVSVHKGSPGNVFAIYNGLVKSFLDRLSREKVGTGNKEPKLRVGSGKFKKHLKPRPITFVVPKTKVSEKIEVAGMVRPVDWSHRWEVRGHWREVKGLGKDREGNYTVPGFTWVMNHTKGPEDKPVIKKTYVVNTCEEVV